MWSNQVVAQAPVIELALHFLQALELKPVEHLPTQGPVKAFDKDVVSGVAWSGIAPPHGMGPRPR